MNSVLKRIFDFLASLKLAVIVIISLAVISAVGTIYESMYDAPTAQKLVYQSIYMYVTMIALMVNLVFVIVDRYPWKKHHLGFILAHIGIILIIIGSYITQKFGIDGSMVFEIGQSSRTISVTDNELVIYKTNGFDSYARIHSEAVDFLKNPPKKNQPYEIKTDGKVFKIIDFYPYSLKESKMAEGTEPEDGPAVRFQIQAPFMSRVEWVHQKAKTEGVFDFGPLKVRLGNEKLKPKFGNEILFWKGDDESFNYQLSSSSKDLKGFSGKLKAGEKVSLPWMGMKLRILKYLSKAKESITYVPIEKPTPLSSSALQIDFSGNKKWVGHNSFAKIFDNDVAYIMSYGNRRIDVGFDIKLDKFLVGRYPGTNRAASYESQVTVPDIGNVVISMNEPLKHNSFTFYQASFQEDEQGKPIASILSVNRDPGRSTKYIGSILLVLGVIIMFYFKKMKRRSVSK